MKVEIVGIYPEDVLKHICSIAKICRAQKSIDEIFESANKMDDSESYFWVKDLLDKGHTSILRFAHVCWIFDDVSKVLTHQLVRHQAGIDFMQRSDRHTTPEDIFLPSGLNRQRVHGMMDGIKSTYEYLIREGVPKEDARYILPQGSLTRIACVANIESIRHIYKVRTNPAAQKEIRDAFYMLMQKIGERNGYLANIIRG